jgi:hypothetical protein
MEFPASGKAEGKGLYEHAHLTANRASRQTELLLQCCRCQQRIPTCLRKGLVIQPADDAVTPVFPVAVRRVIV